MNVEYVLPCGRESSANRFVATSMTEPGRAPRIARLLALAHKLDAMVQSGEVRDYAGLASLGSVSPARLSQILLLLHLAPAIQEEILFMSVEQARRVSEGKLRQISRELDWNHQAQMFRNLAQ